MNELKTVELKTAELGETKQAQMENYKEIKPETKMSTEEMKDQWNNIFNNKVSDTKEGEYYSSYEDRIKYTPTELSDIGDWVGKRGESEFIPSSKTELGRAAKENLAEYGMSGVEYKNGEPDFSKCSEATVQIVSMSENRFDYVDTEGKVQRGNFNQADEKCAEQWNSIGKDGKDDWSARDIFNWRHENKYSWHERCDTKNMDLVSQDIHKNYKHLGGVSECKTRDARDVGGKFDE